MQQTVTEQAMQIGPMSANPGMTMSPQGRQALMEQQMLKQMGPPPYAPPQPPASPYDQLAKPLQVPW